MKKGVATTLLLQAITEGMLDSGPYQFAGDKPDWNRVLQGDRMAALLHNRIFSWGPEYLFRQPCENQGCRASVETVVDLNDLVEQTKALPEESVAHASDPQQNPLEVVLPGCEKRVQFRLLRGSDDKALQRLQKQHKDSLSSSYLRFRTVSVEGVEAPNLKTWLRDLGALDASRLRAAFDEADCGTSGGTT